MSPNPNPHKFTSEDRGHRAPLSPNEPTVYYGIKLPESLKAWCISVGPQYIRRMLQAMKDQFKHDTEDSEDLLN